MASRTMAQPPLPPMVIPTASRGGGGNGKTMMANQQAEANSAQPAPVVHYSSVSNRGLGLGRNRGGVNTNSSSGGIATKITPRSEAPENALSDDEEEEERALSHDDEEHHAGAKRNMMCFYAMCFFVLVPTIFFFAITIHIMFPPRQWNTNDLLVAMAVLLSMAVLWQNFQIQGEMRNDSLQLLQYCRRIDQNVSQLGNDVSQLGNDVSQLLQNVGQLDQRLRAVEISQLGQDIERRRVSVLADRIRQLGQDRASSHEFGELVSSFQKIA
eukprot:CAMPEP_0201717620 /NCGR_PEP_ID=MMETSP0593-20130828/3318_1 /ASSEMBLY_ACC=CAM_ASM_000672 /TAXON_ID=267983 /ORGANISM="Skeletonema japonicum, Strain CCMP2506" /LENGTH=269 /DNA_ID=CAMNT_0048207727 /DNA_START=215 /DNA_END=1024 /DNA_ORIENTATION=+